MKEGSPKIPEGTEEDRTKRGISRREFLGGASALGAVAVGGVARASESNIGSLFEKAYTDWEDSPEKNNIGSNKQARRNLRNESPKI